MDKTSENFKDVLLDVNFYDQIGEAKIAGLNKEWADRACGIISLKMVLEYLAKEKISLKEIFKNLNGGKGYREGVGWILSDIVNFALSRDISSWRRKFYLNEEEKDLFRKEGLDEKSIEKLDRQTEREGISSIIEAINDGYPVMVSIPKHFRKGESGHLIVVTGFRRIDAGKMEIVGLYINDPYPEDEEGKNIFIELNKFQESWNKRAIFFEKN